MIVAPTIPATMGLGPQEIASTKCRLHRGRVFSGILLPDPRVPDSPEPPSFGRTGNAQRHFQGLAGMCRRRFQTMAVGKTMRFPAAASSTGYGDAETRNRGSAWSRPEITINRRKGTQAMNELNVLDRGSGMNDYNANEAAEAVRFARPFERLVSFARSIGLNQIDIAERMNELGLRTRTGCEWKSQIGTPPVAEAGRFGRVERRRRYTANLGK